MRVLGLLSFLVVLAVVDAALRRWGSEAIRRRPRPGGRVTLLFLALLLPCVPLELATQRLWSSAPVAALVLLVLQVPASVAVVLALDRSIPEPRR
jgi:hypothetical protein